MFGRGVTDHPTMPHEHKYAFRNGITSKIALNGGYDALYMFASFPDHVSINIHTVHMYIEMGVEFDFNIIYFSSLWIGTNTNASS